MPGESVPQGLWLPPRVATLVVAAINSTDRDRAQADYLCSGVNDHLEIQAALDALPATGGFIFLLDGTYTLGAQVARAIDDVKIMGCGHATLLNLDGINPVITAGAQDGWLFSHFSTDAGGVSIAAASESAIRSVWIAGVRTDDPATGIVPVTLVVAANDSLDPTRADYQCDGVNDHLEIQAALDALPATGGEVKLLDGTYNLEVALVLGSYQTLRGCGRNTILTTTTNDLDIITAAGVAGTELVGILIADLCVDGNAGGAVNDIGIYWTFVDYSEIRGVYSQNNGEYGIRLFECDFNNIHDNTLCNAGDNISVTTGSHNSYINNICEGGNGISINTDNFSEIAHNTCKDSNINGIEVDSSENVRISHNLCYKNSWNGIFATALHHSSLSHNICIANSQGGDDAMDNIRLEQSDYNLIEGNLCRQGVEINQPKYGINIRQAANDKNVVVGNDLFDAGKTANFYDEGTLTMVRDDNRGIDVIQVKHYVYVKNTSGAQRVAGDVVIIKGIATAIEFATTDVQGDDKVFGMVAETIDNDTSGYVLVKGFTAVLKVDGTIDIAIDDILCTFTTACIAMKATALDQGFALALKAYATDNSNGVIDAYIKSPWD